MAVDSPDQPDWGHQWGDDRFKELHRKLVKFFEWQRCRDPHDLAQETVTRTLTRLPSVDMGEKDAAAYFWGVAKNLTHESQRSTWRAFRREVPLDGDGGFAAVLPADDAYVERLDGRIHLDQKLESLTPSERTLFLAYYSTDAKGRVELAASLGMTPTALRVSVHRMKRKLQPG